MPSKGEAFAPRSYSDELRKRLQCVIVPAGELKNLQFVVVCSRYEGKWLLSRHRERDTWEAQGGHIEAGETPIEAARRELYEESGATDAELFRVCDYLGFTPEGGKVAEATVYLARVRALGPLPESEMAEVRLFDELPENLTYPNVLPKHCAEAEKYMGEHNL
ncbi:MAG: NUDIX domain-containing protein [Clostridia bacterium]|nr:NUDIX domain-containing protein [Clostridia bacterium]